MKFFSDSDAKKRFMKTGLPIMFGIAWTPIIWMVFTASLGPVLFALTGSWPVTLGVTVLIVLIADYLLLKAFQGISDKFYSKNE